MHRWIEIYSRLTRQKSQKHWKEKLSKRLMPWSNQSVAHKRYFRTTPQRKKWLRRTRTIMSQQTVVPNSWIRTRWAQETIIPTWCKDLNIIRVKLKGWWTLTTSIVQVSWIQLLAAVINLLWTISSNRCNSSKTIKLAKCTTLTK